MLIYQIQPRTAKYRDGECPPSFPCEVSLEVSLGPRCLFEPKENWLPEDAEACRIFINGKGPKQFCINANVGRVFVEDSLLERVRVSHCDGDARSFELNGHKLTVSTCCESEKAVKIFVAEVLENLVPMLSIHLPQPVYIRMADLRVGESKFSLETLENPGATLYGSYQDQYEDEIKQGLSRFEFGNRTENRRLLAASAYVHAACRLRDVGNTPFEFLAELILNLAKALEILFPAKHDERRDTYRTELRKLGFSDDEIEKQYVPISILRNCLDVGHPKISEFGPELTLGLARGLNGIEHYFKELIVRVIDKCEAGEYRIPTVTDTTPNRMALSGLKCLTGRSLR